MRSASYSAGWELSPIWLKVGTSVIGICRDLNNKQFHSHTRNIILLWKSTTFVFTVARTGWGGLVRRRWEGCCCCWWCRHWLRYSTPTSSRFWTVWAPGFFPRVKSFTHGRVSQGRRRHGGGFVTERGHHGQGGPAQSGVILQLRRS